MLRVFKPSVFVGLFSFALSCFGNTQSIEKHHFVVLQTNSNGPQILHGTLAGSRENDQSVFQVNKSQRLFQFDHHPKKPRIVLSLEHKGSIKQDRKIGIYTFDYGATNQKSELNVITETKKPRQYYFEPIWGHDESIFYVSALAKEGTKTANENVTIHRKRPNSAAAQELAKNAKHPNFNQETKTLSFVQKNPKSHHEIVTVSSTNKIVGQIRLPTNLTPFFPIPASKNQGVLLWTTEKKPEFVQFWSRLFAPAMAHPSVNHKDYFGWRIQNKDGSLLVHSLNQPISQLRSMDLHRNQTWLGFTTDHGVFLYEMDSGQVKRLREGSNYYHFRWAN